MSLILVADVGTIEVEVEQRCRLFAVIATSVEIVQFESEAELFVYIDSKLRLEMILAVGSVSAVVVAEICIWRVCVGE